MATACGEVRGNVVRLFRNVNKLGWVFTVVSLRLEGKSRGDGGIDERAVDSLGNQKYSISDTLRRGCTNEPVQKRVSTR